MSSQGDDVSGIGLVKRSKTAVTREEEGINGAIKDEGKANTLAFGELSFSETGNHLVGFMSTGADLDW